MVNSKNHATERALQGESLRLAGNYSKAIASFDAALAENPSYPWVYAHRAAARAQLGSFVLAYEDLERARPAYVGGNYPWFLGQKAELFRLWARATLMHMPQYVAVTAESDEDLAGAPPDPADADYVSPGRPLLENALRGFKQLSIAIRLFTRADELLKDNPWILAHRGATRTTRYSIGKPSQRFEVGSEIDFERGVGDFEAACAVNKSYGWAYAFHAVLLGLQGSLDQAVKLIGRAHVNGIDRQLSIVRVMMELAICNGQQGKGGCESAVQFAWQALQLDNEEFFARYFVADGMWHLERKDSADIRSAIERARAELSAAKARIVAMEGGLDCLEGKYDEAYRKLEALRGRCDVDALSLVGRDPAWRDVRKLVAGGRDRSAEAQTESPARREAIFDF